MKTKAIENTQYEEENLRSDIKVKDETIADLRAEITRLRNEIDGNEVASKATIDALRSENERLDDELGAAKHSIDLIEEQLADTQRQLAQARDELSHKQAECDRLSRGMKNLVYKAALSETD